MSNTESAPLVLVVDDHFEMAETVAAGLVSRGFRGVAIGSAEEALRQIASGQHAALVTDLRVPGSDGLELLARSKLSAPESPVVVMTAFSDVDTAVESIRRGAYHYMTKPFKMDELALFLRRALDDSAVRREARELRGALHRPLDSLVGESPPMLDVFDLVRRVARSNAPVLVLGETGTGKGMVARALHTEGGRAHAPFVTVNCAAIPEALLESELFGHVKGAFTGAARDHVGLFEQAHRGTLFLDEIAEMSPVLQSKLLHVLESGRIRPVGSTSERQVDVRIVAATHRSLKQRAAQGTFREDLLYRLDVISIELPPLRHRLTDLPKLIAHFAAESQQKNPGFPRLRLSAEVMNVLTAHDWPGNVRELKHLIERLTLLCNNGEATLRDLPLDFAGRQTPKRDLTFGGKVIPMRELQRRYVSWALEQLGGAKMATCEALGIDSKTLNRWLRDNSEED
ncbi:MAG TPA: sigma-54 dependent transcriptional regulator [Polyangiaceae bacterium]|nr:sigma-54 dependent transcriptional regulator [Polyangiaceae bacterium]